MSFADFFNDPTVSVSGSAYSSSSQKCGDCQSQYKIYRYTHDIDCLDNNCIDPVESVVYGFPIQPYKANNHDQHKYIMDEFGYKEKDLIIFIYYPNSDNNIANFEDGLYLQDEPCPDHIGFEGQRYKLLTNTCIKGFCPPECGGVQCEAVFCRVKCEDQREAEVINVYD